MGVNLGAKAEITAMQMVLFCEGVIERHLASVAEADEANKDRVLFVKIPPTPMETARDAVVEFFEELAKEEGGKA